MRILFCNITWMKDYMGVTEEDKPLKGGAYVKETGSAGERYNFHDYNGHCYGYVMVYGNMALEKYFEGVASTQASVDNVLVIWVSTNENKQTRIVGWYKNATVYRENQYETAFTDPEHDLNYRIKAAAKDCYLLPENQRTFPIERATQAGSGMGIGTSQVWYAESRFAKSILIPEVVNYVENYADPFANTVITDEMLNETIDDVKLDFDHLIEKGHKLVEKGDFLGSLKYYNTARKYTETPDLLFFIGQSLSDLSQYNQAKSLFKKVIELEGEQLDTLERLMFIYDFTREYEKARKCSRKIIALLDDSEQAIDYKVANYVLIFNISVHLNDQTKAQKCIDQLSKLPYDQQRKDEDLKNLKKHFYDHFKSEV